jgi:mannose/fructose-specific phosphotransferase system component IIA
VVVAHGQLAEGFLSALSRVAGPQENLWAVSNEGLRTDQLSETIEAILAEKGKGAEAFLFSDLGGGSCGQACRRLLEDGSVRAVFFGTSLPLLVEFVFLQDEPFDTLIAAMVEKSRTALGVDQ